MALRALILVGVAILLGGCTEASPAAQGSLEVEAQGTAAFCQTGEDESPWEPKPEPVVTNNTTKLHFVGSEMSICPPTGTTPRVRALAWPAFAGPGAVLFQHVATHNGSIAQANGTFWFRVSEITPTTGHRCHLGVAMWVLPPGAGRWDYDRYIEFCPPGPLSGAGPIMPGTYRLELSAALDNQPLVVNRDDTVYFEPFTSGISFNQRLTVQFLFGAPHRDSVIYFQDWQEKPRLAD